MSNDIYPNDDMYLNVLRQANSYVAENRYNDAIDILEALVNPDISAVLDSNTSAIQGVISFSLGDIYRCCDGAENNEHAIEHLSRAIELASSTEDNQVLIAANAALAQVESILGNEELAQQYRQQAIETFQDLPEPAQWRELRERCDNSSVTIQYLLFISCCGINCCTPNPEMENVRISGVGGECRRC